MQSLMKFARPSRLSTLVAAAVLGLGSTMAMAGEGEDADRAAAQASQLYTPGAVTREQVKEELKVARSGGLLTAPGQISEPASVLIARASFNEQQAQRLMAEAQADYDRQVAAAEEEVRRQAMLNDDAYQTSMVSPEETGVQVDVIRMDTNELTTTPDEIVVVAVSDTGDDPELQQQQAEEVRAQLIAMGLQPRQIYLEAAGPVPTVIGD